MTDSDSQDDVEEYARELDAHVNEIGCIELAESLSERRESESEERPT